MGPLEVASLLLATGTIGNIFVPTHGMTVWSGGIAVDIGGGAWAGWNWERFPGVNPPWNPVNAPRQRPVEVDSPVRFRPLPSGRAERVHLYMYGDVVFDW